VERLLDLVLDHTKDEIIGKGITREDFLEAVDNNFSPSVEEFKNARMVLKKNPNGDGCFVLNSYPIPKNE
jgi:hypothetical protein